MLAEQLCTRIKCRRLETIALQDTYWKVAMQMTSAQMAEESLD